MKFNGQSLNRVQSTPYVLPRPDGSHLCFQLSPLPLGFHQRLRSCGVLPPTPPTRIARDSNNKPLRDGHGHALTLADENDAQFLVDAETYHQRVAVLSVFEALRNDTHIEFENVPATEDPNLSAVADALYQELEQAGFSAGDLLMLCREICRISNLLDDHLQQAQRSFFSTAVSNST